MILVATYINHSPIHGFGLFSTEEIRAGTIVWEFMEGFDRRIPLEVVASMPQSAQEFINHFCGLLSSGEFLVTADNDRFVNHSDSPNVETDSSGRRSIALRDIAADEEITEDYRQYDVLWREKGGKQ